MTYFIFNIVSEVSDKVTHISEINSTKHLN